nr:MAG TPA: hypothetical protein [Caudoviricetes sp.]
MLCFYDILKLFVCFCDIVNCLNVCRLTYCINRLIQFQSFYPLN